MLCLLGAINCPESRNALFERGDDLFAAHARLSVALSGSFFVSSHDVFDLQLNGFGGRHGLGCSFLLPLCFVLLSRDDERFEFLLQFRNSLLVAFLSKRR